MHDLTTAELTDAELAKFRWLITDGSAKPLSASALITLTLHDENDENTGAGVALTLRGTTVRATKRYTTRELDDEMAHRARFDEIARRTSIPGRVPSLTLPEVSDAELAWLAHAHVPGAPRPPGERVENARCLEDLCPGDAIAAEVARRAAVAKATPPRPPDARPTWDVLFLDLARTVARRTTCTRALEAYGGIGAVLVETQTHHVLALGYTGSLPGQPHCTDVGCLILEPVPGCQRSIHAEMNAILQAKPSAAPKTLYTNVSPCLKCLQHAIAVGVRRVVFAQLYRLHAEQVALCAAAGVAWAHADG